MKNQIDKKITEIMTKTFDVPATDIDDAASPHTIKSWKGKNHLKMVEALESEFGIKFEAPEIETLVSFNIIRATVLAYLD